jgi:hypothetical protein
MGYRSDVAYTIRFVHYKNPDQDDVAEMKKCKDSFYTFIAEAKANEDTALCFSGQDGDFFKVLEDELEIRFFAEGVKWYSDYKEVKSHEALISLSREWANDNEYIGGAFAMVGEDPTDNSEDYWGQGDCDWVGITRRVSVDWE